MLHRRSLTVPTGPEIVAKAPPGVNPYDYLRAFISAILTPDLPNGFYVNMVLLSVLLLVGLGAAVCVLAWPVRQGRESVRAHLWIVKRKYVPEYRRPYVVPNFTLALAVSFIIHSIWSQIYIWTNYKAYKDLDDSIERQRQTRLFLWYGMIFIPSYVGLWLLAFSGIFAAWFSASPGTTLPGVKHKWLRPEAVNAVCWGVPVLVIITTSAAAGTEAGLHERLLSSSVTFVNNLKTAAITWDAKQSIGTDLNVQLTDESNTFRNQAEAFFAAFAACIGLWAFYLFIACLLFLGSMLALLHLLRLRIRAAGGRGVSIRDLAKGTRFSGLSGSADGAMEAGRQGDGLTPIPTAMRKSLNTRRLLRTSAVSWKRFSVLGPAGAGVATDPRSAFDDDDEQEEFNNGPTLNGNAGDRSSFSTTATSTTRAESSEVIALKKTFWNTLVHFSLLLFFTIVMLGTSLWTAADLAEIEYKPQLRSSTILLGIWPMAVAGTGGMLLLLLRMVTTPRIALESRPMRPLSGAGMSPGHLASQTGAGADDYDENDLEAHARQTYQDEPNDEGDRLKPSPETNQADSAFTLGEAEPEELEDGQRESPEALLGGRQFSSPKPNRSPSRSPRSRRVPVPPVHPLDSPNPADAEDTTPRQPQDPFADEVGLAVATPEIAAAGTSPLGLQKSPPRQEVDRGPELIEVPRAASGSYGGLLEEDDTMEFEDAVDFGYRDPEAR